MAGDGSCGTAALGCVFRSAITAGAAVPHTLHSAEVLRPTVSSVGRWELNVECWAFLPFFSLHAPHPPAGGRRGESKIPSPRGSTGTRGLSSVFTLHAPAFAPPRRAGARSHAPLSKGRSSVCRYAHPTRSTLPPSRRFGGQAHAPTLDRSAGSAASCSRVRRGAETPRPQTMARPALPSFFSSRCSSVGTDATTLQRRTAEYALTPFLHAGAWSLPSRRWSIGTSEE